MNWIDKEIKQTRCKKTIDLFARMLIENKVDFELLGQRYRADQKSPAATVKRLLKQEKVQELVNEKIVEILAKQGVTEDYLVDKRKNAIQIAEEKQRPDWIDTHVSAFEDMLEMRPKVSKQITTATETTKYKLTNDINEALEATNTKEIKQQSDVNNDNKPISNDKGTTNNDTDNE